MNEAEALTWSVHNLSLAELERLTGVSKSTWQRVRRGLKAPPSQGIVKPQSDPSQAIVTDSKTEGVIPISLNNTPSLREGEAEQPPRSRTELFDEWSSNIHPKQLNFAKRYEIDIESVALEYRAYCLGKQQGLKVSDFGEGFWQFLMTAKRNGQHQKQKDADHKERMDRRDQERRQQRSQFNSNPEDQMHPDIKAEYERRERDRELIKERYKGL